MNYHLSVYRSHPINQQIQEQVTALCVLLCPLCVAVPFVCCCAPSFAVPFVSLCPLCCCCAPCVSPRRRLPYVTVSAFLSVHHSHYLTHTVFLLHTRANSFSHPHISHSYPHCPLTMSAHVLLPIVVSLFACCCIAPDFVNCCSCHYLMWHWCRPSYCRFK